MEMKVNVSNALLAVNKILSEGEKVGDEFFLKGLYASSDIEGYTLEVRTDYAQLQIFFHNKHELSGQNRKERLRLLELLNALV